MQLTEQSNITGLLAAWGKGDETSLDELFPMVEQELRRISHNFMRRENPNHTLQTTALINEAFIELSRQHSLNLQDRQHFFALSAQIMRRILVKYARDRACAKRGGNVRHVSLENVELLTEEKSIELIALDEALKKLSKIDPVKSRIVELRYFGGLTMEEIGRILGLATITIAVHWRLAKAWLRREIQGRHEWRPHTSTV